MTSSTAAYLPPPPCSTPSSSSSSMLPSSYSSTSASSVAPSTDAVAAPPPDPLLPLPLTSIPSPSSTQICAICIDNYYDGDWCCRLPDYDHDFHSNCVDLWLAKSHGCPVYPRQFDFTSDSWIHYDSLGD